MKKKILMICFICIIIIIGVLIAYNLLFSGSTKLLFTIQDTSCNCIPNTVYFYSDNTYITKGINDSFIEKGEYEYDIDSLIDSIKKDYEYDDNGLNYHFVLENGEEYFISHYDNNLNNLLSSLNITWY